MPVPWRNASLLPIQPVRIVLDGRPHFFGREREARSQPVHGARNIHANQNAANVEDEGAKPCSCHRLFALCAGSCNGTLIIGSRSEEHTSELQSHSDLVCRLLLEKKKP